MKVFELAKELDIKALDLLKKIEPLKLGLKNHMVELSDEDNQKIRDFLNPKSSTTDETKKKTTVRRKKVDEPEATAAAKTVLTKRKVIVRRESDEAVAASGTEEVAAVEKPEVHVPETLEVSLAPAPQTEVENTEESRDETPVVEAAPAPAVKKPEITPATPVVIDIPKPAPRRYSLIKVVSKEDMKSEIRPIQVIEEAKEGKANIYTSGVSKQPKYVEENPSAEDKGAKPGFTPHVDFDRSPTTSDADGDFRPKRAPAPKVKTETVSENFRSTDFLRRERVYQPKKKKISIGQNLKRSGSTTAAAHKRFVEFDTEMSVEGLARQLNVKAYEVAKKLQSLGITSEERRPDYASWMLDFDTIALVAEEFDFEVFDETFRDDEVLEAVKAKHSSGDENMEPRSPVVTIMGHVDHGKTSLLDFIRKARVAQGESGGITQHIGAYMVDVGEAIKNIGAKAPAGKDFTGKRLTFLDTPGHAAFTEMRARGSRLTDIVVLVVAASEGVMPQTREAVEHAKAAGVPVIVAMNKMDLPDANPDKLKQQLSDIGLLPEDWGGETIYVPISAKTGLGIDKLLENLEIQAEVLELKARVKGLAKGGIIEAKLDKGRGPVATVLVQEGTLNVGDHIVVGEVCGRVRAMNNDRGLQLKSTGPSTPVEVLGLDAVPEAGEALYAFPDEKQARSFAEERINRKRAEAEKTTGRSLEDLFAQMASNDMKELPLILKADTKGSAEAIKASLDKLPSSKIRLKILSSSVGAISTNDVLLAAASKAVIVGFHVRPDNKALNEAESRGIEVRTYDVIYKLIDEVRDLMEGLLDKQTREIFLGRAEVRNVFTITKVGAVAGCYVVKGKILRNANIRLLRDSVVVFTGKLSGLKRFKDDAREVAENYECGMSLDGYNDIKVGDIIEAFQLEEVKQSLESAAPENRA